MKFNFRKYAARLLGKSIRPREKILIPDIPRKPARHRRMDHGEMGIYAARIMTELSRHIGRQNAIGMGELFEVVFQKQWNNRINDTRMLRHIITELRFNGAAICSYCANDGTGGYYQPSAGSEMDDYRRRVRRRALKGLILYKKLGGDLPELYGQLDLKFKGDGYDEAA